MKIIAFPFAGGNKYSFNFMKEELNKKNIELIVIEYPGRGERIKEPLLDNIEEVVKDIYPKVIDELEKNTEEYVLYGHSMGGLVAYLIASEINLNLVLRNPLKLIVSGRESPIVERKEKRYHLPHKDFWEKVYDLGGPHKEVLENIEIRTLYEPILRSDFKCVEETFFPRPKKISIPIDVLYGSEEFENPLNILKWNEESTKQVRIIELEGDHFFIYNHVKFITELFVKYNK